MGEGGFVQNSFPSFVLSSLPRSLFLSMLALFSPVNNTLGYDLREVTFSPWEVHMKIIAIKDYKWILHELPTYHPINYYENYRDFCKQFIEYIYPPNLTLF